MGNRHLGPDGYLLGFTCGSAIKNLPAMQETKEMHVPSLGWEDSLEEKMATHSSILAWRILWTEEPDGLQSIGLDNTEQLNNTFTEETTYANTRVKS